MRYFSVKGEDTTTIHRNITEVYGDVMNVKMVCRWCRHLLNGRTDVSDEKQEGRLREINTNTIDTVRFLIEDWCQTMDEIVHYFKKIECNPLSHGTSVKIIHEKLEMSKVCV